MAIKRPKPSAREQRTVDEAVMAYVAWREGCISVDDAYRRWTDASSSDTALAHGAYRAALDREQAAAEAYAGLMRQVGDLVETDLDHPLLERSSAATSS
jgi:hypothetical protein